MKEIVYLVNRIEEEGSRTDMKMLKVYTLEIDTQKIYIFKVDSKAKAYINIIYMYNLSEIEVQWWLVSQKPPYKKLSVFYIPYHEVREYYV